MRREQHLLPILSLHSESKAHDGKATPPAQGEEYGDYIRCVPWKIASALTSPAWWRQTRTFFADLGEDLLSTPKQMQGLIKTDLFHKHINALAISYFALIVLLVAGRCRFLRTSSLIDSAPACGSRINARDSPPLITFPGKARVILPSAMASRDTVDQHVGHPL